MPRAPWKIWTEMNCSYQVKTHWQRFLTVPSILKSYWGSSSFKSEAFSSAASQGPLPTPVKEWPEPQRDPILGGLRGALRQLGWKQIRTFTTAFHTENITHANHLIRWFSQSPWLFPNWLCQQVLCRITKLLHTLSDHFSKPSQEKPVPVSLTTGKGPSQHSTRQHDVLSKGCRINWRRA